MSKMKELVPAKVYDFLKVIWQDFDQFSSIENVATVIYTLSDPDFDRWMSENMEFGSQDGLNKLSEKYQWEVGDELPSWLNLTENRLIGF